MASMTINSFTLAANESTIYGGFFLFVIGMIGNTLNIIIFTSLKTFRETSAAFYMTVTSAVNIFQLVIGLLSRILISGYNIDPTKTSDFLCKGHGFILTATMLIAFTYKCFAVIDQYFSLTNRWHYLCNLKVARRLVIASLVFWCLHGISSWILEGVHLVPSTNQTSCIIVNPVFSVYMSRFVLAVLIGFLPLLIRISFGLLAFYSVRLLKTRRVPMVRLERDKQLTAVVLIEVLVDVILIVPYCIFNHLYSSIVTLSDPIIIARNQLIGAVIRLFFYANFAISFYIYYCVSLRFRKQVKHVLFEIHLKFWREKIFQQNTNQVTPQSTDDVKIGSMMNCIRKDVITFSSTTDPPINGILPARKTPKSYD